MILSINRQSVFRTQIQDPGLKKIINQVNANFANKKKYDTVDLSQKAQELLRSKNESKDKDPIINYEDSQQVGKHTQAEWAEMSLHHQRNGLETIAKVIDYSKAKLDYTMSNINELENFLTGTGTHSDPYMTQAKAGDYLKGYQESIVTDYTQLIENYANVYRSFIDQYDQSSGGIASQVMRNQINDISAKTLGLTELSEDPSEIMKALENASKQVNDMIANLENAFTAASGGKVWESVSPTTEDAWAERLESFRLKTEVAIIDKNVTLSDQFFEIDQSLLVGIQRIVPTNHN